ncbi:MAG: glycine/sarcosine/betaine reductase selenoprotein B family protein [Proteobacteria bacterium]|nr:glycine/sarcosine/betaine reductase selenoprotein B family protein [Pseudomonadota bacterium]
MALPGQSSITTPPGIVPDDDVPVPYLQRTRDWYLALGYDNPYVWAHYRDVPFQALVKPLSQSTVALITTAAPYQPDKGNQGPGAAYNAAAKFYAVYSGDSALDHDVRVSHVAIDRKHTNMEDPGCWFPLPLLRQFEQRGRIGALAKRFHGAPTNRSQQHTIDVDCPEILRRCREDGVDAVVLVPNCPVCHQTVSLIARHLEQNGIATVIMACAKDIVEHCGVPRMLFSDFPLGNAAGRPHDSMSQADTLERALCVLEAAPAARTTVQSPLSWSGSHAWKGDYSNIAKVSTEEVARLRAENDRAKETAKALRDKQADA